MANASERKERDIAHAVAFWLGEVGVNKSFDPGKGKSPYLRFRAGIEEFVEEHIHTVDFRHPTVEGESKRIFQVKSRHKKEIALVELKPTLYSFTANRYGVVEGTDKLRLDFWELFAGYLNRQHLDRGFGFFGLQTLSHWTGSNGWAQHIASSLPTNFLGRISVEGKDYAIVTFADSLPPIEVVWKKYFVGSMKHNLKGVDKHPRTSGYDREKMESPILYEAKLPEPIVRYDWRNPLPDKDECIPDEFARMYIETLNAQYHVRGASEELDNLLRGAGYELVDICYFMDHPGRRIYSEISPDCMRIRKKEESFDKDLWRQGKDAATIISTWTELYRDLKCLESRFQ